METNVIGVIRVTNAMLPLLLRSTSQRIVNMSERRLAHPAEHSRRRNGADCCRLLAVEDVPERRHRPVRHGTARHEHPGYNAACPGFTATDLNRFRGVRTPEQGVAIAIQLATLADGGPTGGFFDDAGVVPW